MFGSDGRTIRFSFLPSLPPPNPPSLSGAINRLRLKSPRISSAGSIFQAFVVGQAFRPLSCIKALGIKAGSVLNSFVRAQVLRINTGSAIRAFFSRQHGFKLASSNFL